MHAYLVQEQGVVTSIPPINEPATGFIAKILPLPLDFIFLRSLFVDCHL